MVWWNEWLRGFNNLDLPEEKVDPIDPILDSMEENGYTYDSGNDWWERIWTTNEGKETIREVYQQLENGDWNKLMIVYGDRIFYEEKV